MFLSQIFCICDRSIIAGLLTNKWLRMYLWWSLCTLCLLACQAIVTVGYSGLLLCLSDIFSALSVYAVMSKNIEPNEWLKFARVWLCFIFILALNLSLFSFWQSTVSVFILAVNGLFSFWQSTVSVFILAVDCLCFHSGSRLSMFSFWRLTVSDYLLTDKLPWTPSSTRCRRVGHRFRRWLNRLRMARARRRPMVGRCRWLSARPSFAIFSRSTNVRRTRYFISWTQSFIARREKKSFSFVVVPDQNTKW